MTFETLITPAEAEAHLADETWAFVDCTFVLAQPEAGHAAYLQGHVPGAVYADLDSDLAGPVIPGRTGRHPLPAEEAFAATATRLGIGATTQVVAYDAGSGVMAAARLWWLLKWAGHDAVAVLDGGLAAWTAAGLPLGTQSAATSAGGPGTRTFVPAYRPELVATAEEIEDMRTIVDARTVDRFRGDNETIDPVGGHIPGAFCRPFAGNLAPDGSFLPSGELRNRFATISAEADSTAFYCGSGVTAAHNVLAFAHAGLGMPRLYPGSWSEWITDPGRPVELGDPANATCGHDKT